MRKIKELWHTWWVLRRAAIRPLRYVVRAFFGPSLAEQHRKAMEAWGASFAMGVLEGIEGSKDTAGKLACVGMCPRFKGKLLGQGGAVTTFSASKQQQSGV